MGDPPSLSNDKSKTKMDEKNNEWKNIDSPDGFREFLKKTFAHYSCSKGEKDPEDFTENKPKQPPKKGSHPNPDPIMASELDGDEYHFDNPKRGLAIIINNEDFSRSREFGDRPGSSYDASSLYHSFKSMGFDVQLFTDLAAWKMVEVLKAAIKEYDHTQADCFACSILTHGDQTWSDKEWDRMGTNVRLDLLFGTDGKALATKAVVEMFNNQNCPALKNKPRLFFLQACRGDKYDDGQAILVKKNVPSATTRYHYPGAKGDGKDGKDGKDGVDNKDETDKVNKDPSPKSSTPPPLPPPTTEFERQVSLSSSVDPPEYNQPRDTTDAAKAEPVADDDDEDGEAVGEGGEGEADKTDALWHSIKEVSVTPAPLYQDCLIMYATPPGHFAWRRKTGAWFIQCLCKLFDSNVLQHVSLIRGLSYVCGKVAREYQSENPSNPSMHHKKEVPVVESMLVKDIFMRKKPVVAGSSSHGSHVSYK